MNVQPQPTDRHVPFIHAAKWPPDDADVPGAPGVPPAPGGFGGGSFDPNEGNFKKGATKPILIILGVLAVVGAAVLAIFAVKGEGDKMTVDQIAAERKAIAVLPKADQLPKWREWAKRDDVVPLQEDAFANLAWAKDEQGLKTIIEHGLQHTEHKVRNRAAQAISDYGSPMADSAKPALLKALKESDSTDKPQIAWALCVLKESSVFDDVLTEYRAGHLATIQRLDGYPAFDPDTLAGMVSLDKLASYANDPSESMRQLIATILSRTGDPKWTPTLVTLVQDKEPAVGREAAVGLGKIANEASIGPLLVALDNASKSNDKDSRKKFLEALRDGVGANGLILALRSVQKNHEFFQTDQIFKMLEELEDPRGADLLVKYIETNPHPHWKAVAAIRLAEIGDLRAVPTLAWRLTQDPVKLYKDDAREEIQMMARNDDERTISARMLADLAILNPDKVDQIRAQSEDAVLGWITSHPQPHANGLRALVVMKSTKVMPKLRRWADPTEALPPEGAQPPMPDAFATAQSGLRYLGWSQDPAGWDVLSKQLNRRPPKLDVTMASLQQGGLAIIGMAVKALASGASDGFAQWGDPKAYPMLVKHIEDPLGNESSRYEACFALSWVATDDNMREVVKKVHDFNKADDKAQLIRGCYLESLIHRPVPAANAGLVDLINPTADPQVAAQAARAIGFGGMDNTISGKLMDMLKDNSVRNYAMLALLIGADPDTVARSLAQYTGSAPELMEDLKAAYDKSFGYWSDKDYDVGNVARWIANAEACRYVKVNDAYQDWPRMILERDIQGIVFDNGPHSITRVQFRMRLIADAKGTDPKKQKDAIGILKFMKEKGVLMALRNEPGPLGDLAKRAFFEVMNPKLTDQSIPTHPSATATGGNVMPPK
jgi:HEAT repeat protein